MRNEAERKAFEAWFKAETTFPAPLISNRVFGKEIEQYAFQAGAAYQREQDKKLVEATEKLIGDFDSEIHNEYDGTSMLNDRLAEIDYAREALAAYRAQQEGK